MTQNNLGNALRILGKREGSTERLEEAVTAFREALKEHTRERVPLQWARTQNNLGNALWILWEHNGERALLADARASIQAAYAGYQSAGHTQYYAYFQETLASIDKILVNLPRPWSKIIKSGKRLLVITGIVKTLTRWISRRPTN